MRSIITAAILGSWHAKMILWVQFDGITDTRAQVAAKALVMLQDAMGGDWSEHGLAFVEDFADRLAALGHGEPGRRVLENAHEHYEEGEEGNVLIELLGFITRADAGLFRSVEAAVDGMVLAAFNEEMAA